MTTTGGGFAVTVAGGAGVAVIVTGGAVGGRGAIVLVRVLVLTLERVVPGLAVPAVRVPHPARTATAMAPTDIATADRAFMVPAWGGWFWLPAAEPDQNASTAVGGLVVQQDDRQLFVPGPARSLPTAFGEDQHFGEPLPRGILPGRDRRPTALLNQHRGVHRVSGCSGWCRPRPGRCRR
jgi:hypothetical protein